MKTLLCILLLAISATTYGQQPGAPIDMAATDITAMPDFDGAKVFFRGLRLGMSKAEAIQKLKSFQDFTWYFDSYNTKSESPASKAQMRIYVKLKDKTGVDDPDVLYLQWLDGKPGMDALVFYHALIPGLKGGTVKLFTTDALDASSDCRKFLRGEPVKETDNIGITTYTFPAQHFQLISMPDGGKEMVWFKFVM